jgi:predicted dehydrogenase
VQPSPLNVAMIGCGWVAGLQIENGFAHLPELFRVAACCDLDEERSRAFAERFGIGRTFGSLEACLRASGIDVVSICTPPSMHYPMLMEALAAGRHAICEKPFTSSLRLADAVVEAERGGPARVMPIFQYRFGTGVERARHVIASGLLGRPLVSSVETAWSRGPDYYQVPWRGRFATELGGVLLTQAIHVHDLFTWLMGPAARLAAFKATRVNPIEVEDCAVAALQMPDGSLASLTATLGSAEPVTRIRLCFEHGTIERVAAGAAAIRPGDEPWAIIPRTADRAAAIDAVARDVGASPHAGFARQFELFHAALLGGTELPVTLADARRSLELITALFHAAETGTVVDLPIGPDHPRYDGWVAGRPGS